MLATYIAHVLNKHHSGTQAGQQYWRHLRIESGRTYSQGYLSRPCNDIHTVRQAGYNLRTGQHRKGIRRSKSSTKNWGFLHRHWCASGYALIKISVQCLASHFQKAPMSQYKCPNCPRRYCRTRMKILWIRPSLRKTAHKVKKRVLFTVRPSSRASNYVHTRA